MKSTLHSNDNVFTYSDIEKLEDDELLALFNDNTYLVAFCYKPKDMLAFRLLNSRVAELSVFETSMPLRIYDTDDTFVNYIRDLLSADYNMFHVDAYNKLYTVLFKILKFFRIDSQILLIIQNKIESEYCTNTLTGK